MTASIMCAICGRVAPPEVEEIALELHHEHGGTTRTVVVSEDRWTGRAGFPGGGPMAWWCEAHRSHALSSPLG